MAKTLITGGTGFVGSYLIKKLVDRGESVRALKRRTSKMHLLGSYAEKVDWVEGDVLDVFAVEAAMQGIEQVYHSAAMISFNPRERDAMMKINIEGTANMVNMAMEAGVKKFLHVSSISAFGRTKIAGAITEQTAWHDGKKNTNYAISKFLSEREVWRAMAEGLSAVIVNPSTILGAGDWSTGPGLIFTRIWNGLKFYTTGTNGFVDVRDVVDVSIQLMDSEITNQRYILSAENWTFKDLFHLIAKELKVRPPGIEAGTFLGEVAWRWDRIRGWFTGRQPLITKETARMASLDFRYDNSKVRDALNVRFRPIPETVRDTCRAFRKSRDEGKDYAVFY